MSEINSSPSPEVTLPHQPVQEIASFQNPEHQKIDVQLIKAKILYWLHKAVSVLLLLHGILETWEIVQFLVVEYPELNHLLEIGKLTEEELAFFAVTVILAAVETGISFFLAHRMHHMSEEADLTFDFIISTLFLFVAPSISHWIAQQDFSPITKLLLK